MNEQPSSTIEKILDHARWAPSGDNMQTWRFEIIAADHFVVHGYDTRDHCVYDLQGQASQFAIGALLESIAIAASAFAQGVEFQLRNNMPETKPTIDVKLISQADVQEDPLFPYLPIRSVQRRKFKLTPLTPEQKTALEQSVRKFYTVHWLEGWQNRWQAAWLMYKNAKLRLTLPEAFPTHSTIIEWNARFSEDKIPDQAVGLDPVATWLMKWALKSWQRVSFLNTYCFGTLLPRIELDLLPGICCAAHFALIAEKEPQSIEDNLQAGRAIQRFWLTATQLGLQLQPEMTPLIFSGYVNRNIVFTSQIELITFAADLSHKFSELLGVTSRNAVFVGRLGKGAFPNARSIRLPVVKLMTDDISQIKIGDFG
jgi:nitroreductase